MVPDWKRNLFILLKLFFDNKKIFSFDELSVELFEAFSWQKKGDTEFWIRKYTCFSLDELWSIQMACLMLVLKTRPIKQFRLKLDRTWTLHESMRKIPLTGSYQAYWYQSRKWLHKQWYAQNHHRNIAIHMGREPICDLIHIYIDKGWTDMARSYIYRQISSCMAIYT